MGESWGLGLRSGPRDDRLGGAMSREPPRDARPVDAVDVGRIVVGVAAAARAGAAFCDEDEEDTMSEEGSSEDVNVTGSILGTGGEKGKP